MLLYPPYQPVIRPTTDDDGVHFHNALQDVIDTINRTERAIWDVTTMAHEPTGANHFRWTIMGSGGYFIELRIHPDDANSLDMEVFTPFQAVYCSELFYTSARSDIMNTINAMGWIEF